ncbi:MAG: DUF4296 domain-containing protein [Bacteroidota bacterium]
MKKLYISITIALAFAACQSDGNLKNLPIPKEKLVKVVSDAYIVEGAIQNYTQDIKDSLSDVYYQQLYEIHDITEKDFQRSLDIIKNHPEALDSLYQNISIHLDKLEDLK